MRTQLSLVAVLALTATATPMAIAAPAAPTGTVRATATTACDDHGDWILEGDAGIGVGQFSAVGSPRRTISGLSSAGVVLVRTRFGSAQVLTSASTGVPAQADARFGAAVAPAPVNSADACPDLIVGVPGANGGRGAVAVIPSSAEGFLPASARWLPTASLGLAPGDALGTAVTAVATTGGTLVVAGAPGRDVAGAVDAGALVGWLVPTGGAPFTIPAPGAPVTYSQGAGGLLGKAEAGDRFGSVIAARMRTFDSTIAVGIPMEDIGAATNTGSVARLTFTGTAVTANTLVWQGSGLPGTSHSGDHLGAALVARGGDLRAVGMPGRNANSRTDSGAVIVRTPAGTFKSISQNSAGVPGTSEKGDMFGAALTGLIGTRGQETLGIAIGAPGENVGTRVDAGAVTFAKTDEGAPNTLLYESQKATGIVAGDKFGSRLVTVVDDWQAEEDQRDTLLIGAPGEDVTGASNAGRYWTGAVTGISIGTLSTTGTQTSERLGG